MIMLTRHGQKANGRGTVNVELIYQGKIEQRGGSLTFQSTQGEKGASQDICFDSD